MQGGWQTGHMTMMTLSPTVDSKHHRSDDLKTHVQGQGQGHSGHNVRSNLSITSRPMSSRVCLSVCLFVSLCVSKYLNIIAVVDFVLFVIKTSD